MGSTRRYGPGLQRGRHPKSWEDAGCIGNASMCAFVSMTFWILTNRLPVPVPPSCIANHWSFSLFKRKTDNGTPTHTPSDNIATPNCDVLPVQTVLSNAVVSIASVRTMDTSGIPHRGYYVKRFLETEIGEKIPIMKNILEHMRKMLASVIKRALTQAFAGTESPVGCLNPNPVLRQGGILLSGGSESPSSHI